ncbi:hypothetical protein M378DRAFT_158821 [Amanita muscaria Koide BX008]|uniref:AB hydrolase-1 domain-containing protein n=1 Tax=Amanita muscaria (strain Koide BX008) TaxID=946122 RepID=A0A0C2XFS2_AMAMK|nr:hypothetical protein M378DRAFT_158821 [Amanita muscaria Koide BX008]
MSAATSFLPPLPPAREIPSAFAASLRSWWSVGEKQSAISEERLLRRLPFFRPTNHRDTPISKNSNTPVVAYSSHVNLDTPKHFLNTLTITSTAPSPHAPPPALLLHGYGAGLGFFFRNLGPLAQWADQRGSAVYAVDWLGMGRSSRVPFTVKAKKDDIPGRVREAEAFFVDSLEQWRCKVGLEKMTLIGHSLGAYFSVAYALKYPTRVNKLILLSPAGVPHGPNTTVPSRELTDSAETRSLGAGSAEPASPGKLTRIKSQQESAKKQESRARRLLTYLWEEGWSPFQVVRASLFWGPWLIGKYSSRRFQVLTEEETRDIHDYIMNITLAKGSGEYCISHILAPGAHARMPLVDRVSALKVPVTFVYGEFDWMDPQGGIDSVERLRQAGNGQGRMYLINNAGHHGKSCSCLQIRNLMLLGVYLDNPDAVNGLLVKELNKT